MGRFLVLQDIQGNPIGCWDNVLNQPAPMDVCKHYKNMNATGVIPNKRLKNVSSKYNYYQQTRYNGVNKYYGVNVIADQQFPTELNGLEFYKLTTAPLMLVDGFNIYKPHLVTGSTLIALTERIGRDKKLAKRTIAQYMKLLPYRSTMLMALSNKNIPIANENDIYEVAIKYGRIHPDGRPKISEAKYKRAFQADKSGVDGFDAAGIFAAIGSIVDGIVGAVSAGNIAQQIKDFVVQYKKDMDTDLGAIQTTYNATREAPGPWSGYGAIGALGMLLQYKRTSWGELKAYIEDLSQKAGQVVPEPIKRFWAEQDRLEQSFRQEIAAAYQSGTDAGGQALPPLPKVPMSDLDPKNIFNQLNGINYGGGSGGNNSQSGVRPPGSFDLMKFINDNMTIIIIAIAVIILLFYLGRKK
jgi:hypothetical protein